MNRNRLLIIIGVSAFIALAGFLLWLGLQSKPQSGQNEVTNYTNSITKQSSNAYLTDNTQSENGQPQIQPYDTITIFGLDEFFATIDQTQANSILSSLTSFIRARVGAKGTQAAIVDAKVTKISDGDPKQYTCTMQIVNPSARYTVTISIPTTTNVAPTVTFTGVGQ